MRQSMVLLLFLSVACATPTLAPDQFAVVEEGFGLYSRMGQTSDFSLSRSTLEIPCSPNAVFGVDLKLEYSVDRRMKLPLVGEWRQPEIPGIRHPVVRVLPEPFYIKPGKHTPGLQALVGFEGEQDLVEGEYEFRLRNPETEHIYYSRTFILENCR